MSPATALNRRAVSTLLLLASTLAAEAVHSGPIKNLQELNEHIAANPETSWAKVGFLSQGNYDSVKSVLPKSTDDGGPLTVVISQDIAEIEQEVLDGNLAAGLSTSCPDNTNGQFNTFGAGLITPRASFFTIGDESSPTDSTQLKEAWDAAIIRSIADGDYETIESQYWESNKFDSVGAFTCSIDVSLFPFPPADQATGLLQKVLSTGVLTMGALGPNNWGYQGNYLISDPTGLWPDYVNKIFDKFNTAYGGNIQLNRVFNESSASVMQYVLDGTADLTEPYWTLSASHDDRARTHLFDLSCTVLGTESCFFSSSQSSAPTSESSNDDSFPGWAIAVIVILGLLLISGSAFLCLIICREKQGKPMFYSALRDARQREEQKEIPMKSDGIAIAGSITGPTRGSIHNI